MVWRHLCRVFQTCMRLQAGGGQRRETCTQHGPSRFIALRSVQEEEVPLPEDPLATVLMSLPEQVVQAGSEGQASDPSGGPRLPTSEQQPPAPRPKPMPKPMPVPMPKPMPVQPSRSRSPAPPQASAAPSRSVPPPPPPEADAPWLCTGEYPPPPPGTTMRVLIYVNGWTLFGLTALGQRSQVAVGHAECVLCLVKCRAKKWRAWIRAKV